MAAKMTVNLVVPRVPNFVRIEGTLGMKDIACLNDAELNLLADAWRTELIAHAKQRRFQGIPFGKNT